MIYLHIRVKFRAFGITFGTVEQSNIPVPLPLTVPPFDERVVFNDRGIYVTVRGA